MSGLSHLITLLDTGEQFLCRSDEAVLVGMARLGMKGVPVGCRSGGCGVCKIQIIRGSYRKRVMSRDHVSQGEEADGFALACRVFPDSELQIRAIEHMETAVARTKAWQRRGHVSGPVVSLGSATAGECPTPKQ